MRPDFIAGLVCEILGANCARYKKVIKFKRSEICRVNKRAEIETNQKCAEYMSEPKSFIVCMNLQNFRNCFVLQFYRTII